LRKQLKVTWGSLFIPTRAELSAYLRLWERFAERLRPTAAV